MAFRKAERKRGKLRLGIIGPAGSGKTYSSLLIASGIGGKVAMIDTENGSGDLYAHLWDYDIAPLNAPHTPKRYTTLIDEAGEAGYDVLIIDSLSHAWGGVGGVLEMVDKAASVSRNQFAAWRDVTPQHNAMVDAILQSPMHVIVTMRSKIAYDVNKSDDGKTKIAKVGLAPVQRAGLEYEFTTVLELSIDGHIASITKDRTSLFDGELFTPSRETGERFLDWLNAGVDPVEYSSKIKATLESEIAEVKSKADLITWYKSHDVDIGQLIPDHREEIISLLSQTKKELGNGSSGKGN